MLLAAEQRRHGFDERLVESVCLFGIEGRDVGAPSEPGWVKRRPQAAHRGGHGISGHACAYDLSLALIHRDHEGKTVWADVALRSKP